jgi:hypothetical protein
MIATAATFQVKKITAFVIYIMEYFFLRRQ